MINQDLYSKYLIKNQVGIILILNFSYTSHYKTCWHIVLKKTDNVNSKVLKSKNGKIEELCYYQNVVYVVVKIKIYERATSKRIVN